MCTPIRTTETDVSSENEHKHFGMIYNALCVRGEHIKICSGLRITVNLFGGDTENTWMCFYVKNDLSFRAS